MKMLLIFVLKIQQLFNIFSRICAIYSERLSCNRTEFIKLLYFYDNPDNVNASIWKYLFKELSNVFYYDIH